MADAGLISALARCQAKFPPIVKSHSNPAFKGSQYADVADVLAAVRPVLAAEGIVVTQVTQVDNETGGVILITRLMYGEDGEQLSSVFPLYVSGLTDQQIGSKLTYTKRYQLCAILGVHPVGDDDDGNLAATAAPEPVEAEDITRSREAVQEAIAGLSDADKELVKLEMRNQKVPSLKGPGATRAQLDGLVEFIAGLKERAEPFELNATTAEGRVMTSEGLGDAGVIPATEPTATVSETRPGEPASQTQPPFNPVRAARASLPGSQRKALDSSMKAEKP